MELIWYGFGCFRMIERGYPTVITDPYEPQKGAIRLPNTTSEIVVSSRILEKPETAEWPGVPGVIHTIAGPGEYEIGGVFITGVPSHRRKKSKRVLYDNVIYTINQGDVVVCSFGECGEIPNQAQLEVLGRVNVLLIPVGLPDGLTPAMASEIVSLIEPDIVIPTYYDVTGEKSSLKPVKPFLNLMGVDAPSISTSIKVEPNVLPEATQVILLDKTQ